MSEDNSYLFNGRTTVLTLRHDIGRNIKGIKIKFTNAEGETVEYEDTKEVGDSVLADAPVRRTINMVYRNLVLAGKRYNLIVEGLADSQLDTLNVTATVQEEGEAGLIELEEPNYEIELLF